MFKSPICYESDMGLCNIQLDEPDEGYPFSNLGELSVHFLKNGRACSVHPFGDLKLEGELLGDPTFIEDTVKLAVSVLTSQNALELVK